jgi:hypothetical protein
LALSSPATAPQKDYYYTFFVSQLPQTSTAQATAQIGSHILLSLSSTQNPPPKTTITSFSVAPYFIDTFFTPITLSGEVNNPSTYFTPINGKISITKNGQNFGVLTLFPHNTLSRSSRTLHCLSSDSTAHNCVLRPPYWPGVYQATLTLDSGTSTAIQFFVFPYALVGCVIVIIFCFFIIKIRSKK